MKKNREAKKAKKELESSNSTTNGQITSTTTSIKMELTDDPEKNKKIKKVKSVSICTTFVLPFMDRLYHYHNENLQ